MTDDDFGRECDRLLVRQEALAERVRRLIAWLDQRPMDGPAPDESAAMDAEWSALQRGHREQDA